MIGHYLLTLTPDAEDDVLTGILKPGSYGNETERCLVGWAAGYDVEHHHFTRRRLERNTHWGFTCIEERFDGLCYRFGVERIANAIRSRILANQAHRALSGGTAWANHPEISALH
jgi:hypothetical protein